MCSIDSDRGIAEAHPDGPLSSDDFRALAAEIDPYLERDGILHGLVIVAQHFPGWEDFAGLVSHLRFVRSHHTRVERVAFVSDDDLLAILPRVAAHFVAAEVKIFPADELERARGWAATGEGTPPA